MIVLRDKDFPPEPVNVITDGEFDRREDITELYIPDRIWSIGMFAFSGCSGLTEIWLPYTLTKIDKGSFYGCSRLTEIMLPDTLTKIGEGAFLGCSGLTELWLPWSIKFLGAHAFGECTSLKAVITSADVASKFREDMFEDCGTSVSTLLANATPDLGLRYYWTPKNYQLCSLVSKEAVFTLLLVNNRLNSDSELKKSKNNLELEKKDVLHGLPIELWFEILSFVCRHQLGRK